MWRVKCTLYVISRFYGCLLLRFSFKGAELMGPGAHGRRLPQVPLTLSQPPWRSLQAIRWRTRDWRKETRIGYARTGGGLSNTPNEINWSFFVKKAFHLSLKKC